jgi:LCP family protein required for cell wall assembly
MKKKLIIIGVLIIWGLLGVAVWQFLSEEDINILAPIVEKIDIEIPGKEKGRNQLKADSVFEGETLNVLLVGIDTSEGRRNRGQGGFNTDTMILASVNSENNKVLLTSVPRDLWINGNKLNALYTVYGEDTLVDAFEKVTGLAIDGVIRADFDHLIWLVDMMGGVPVDVQRTFTDSSFPNWTDSRAITVSFTEGNEIMDGQRALTFARSRKGTNGEGSDLMRARRQHLILKGMIEGISQEKSQFWPMDIEDFYNVITTPTKLHTTLTLADVKYMWDFYKDRDEYTIESFVVDGEYVYHPGMYPASPYHAWVFVAKEPGFANLHRDIRTKLDNTFTGETTIIQMGPEYVEDTTNEQVSNTQEITL